MLRLNHHHTAAVLLNVPFGVLRWLTRVRYKFNVTRLAVEKN